jgi:hypothetical protein
MIINIAINIKIQRFDSIYNNYNTDINFFFNALLIIHNRIKF